MCYHRYTLHSCGHSSRSIGKCSIDTLASQVPFCESYHIVKDRALELCGVNYCKEDKETAHWVENGQALLTACDDDLAKFKNRLVDLYPKLQAFDKYKQAFGTLQPNDMDKARTMHEEYVELSETYAKRQDRRQLILGGMKKAKEKQQATHAERMRRVQQYVDTQNLRSVRPAPPQTMARVHQTSTKGSMKRTNSGMLEPGVASATPSRPVGGQILRSVQPTSPQSMARVNQTSLTRSIKRTSSGIWETQDDFATPSRPAIQPVSPVKLKRKRSSLSGSAIYSPPNLASPFSVTDRKTNDDLILTTPKKRRGRPPKSKAEDIMSQAQTDFYGPNDDSLMANDQSLVPERRTTKRSNKKKPAAQPLAPSGVRRSGRATQRVSYAESPSSSPERLDPEVESTIINQPERSARVTRTTSSKKAAQQDDLYATDGENRDEDVDDDDDEWQGGEGIGEDDTNIVPDTAQKIGSKSKRTATSPPKDATILNRQATSDHRDTGNHTSRHCEELTAPDVHSRQEVSNNRSIYMDTITSQSTNPGGGYSMPSTPSNNMAVGSMSRLLYQNNLMADGSDLNPKGSLGQQLDPGEMSPLTRSDWMNGLTRPVMALSFDDIQDPNTYDFDVNAMSRAVADFDAQQG